MEKASPVYTTENGCQDCYKCVRHCPVKAIRIVGGKASVIPQSCVACGECVKVCPAHAKKIRSDLARLKELLSSGAKVIASIAPSFTGYFPGVSISQLSNALIRAGFHGASETAHGAESVSAHVARILEQTGSPLLISSACPAAVDMIRKYLPAYAPYISPLPSPARAHARRLKETYGQDVKVVFFGPCAAKKNEADAHPDELSLSVIFPAMERLLDERGISYTDRHIKEENPTYEELKAWYEASGLPLKKFFNTSGLLYKEMQLKDKLPAMSEDEMIELLSTNGMLVKRPLIIGEDFVLVGFKEAEWEKLK